MEISIERSPLNTDVRARFRTHNRWIPSSTALGHRFHLQAGTTRVNSEAQDKEFKNETLKKYIPAFFTCVVRHIYSVSTRS